MVFSVQNEGAFFMERKQIAGIALIGLILAAILGFATFKTMQTRQIPPSVAEADQAGG